MSADMEGKEKSKHRLKSLFRDKEKEKEKKSPRDGSDIDAFLHGASDKLNFPAPTPSSPNSPSSPPRLSRIDTNTARRWPTTAEVQNARGVRTRAATTSLTRSKKGLVVRFTDAKPEIIGEGGEEAEDPTISLRSRANTHPPQTRTGNGFEKAPAQQENIRPMPMRRTQTGFESIPDVGNDHMVSATRQTSDTPQGESTSFAARVKAEIQGGEGKILVQAASNTSKAVQEQIQHNSGSNLMAGDSNHNLDEAQINSMKNANITIPSGLPPQLMPGRSSPKVSENGTVAHLPYPTSRSTTTATVESATPSRVSSTKSTNTVLESLGQLSRSSTMTLQAAAVALGDDALEQFWTRVSHLLSLFRLSSESSHPLANYSLAEFARVATWWFLQGRLTLETAIRDRPTTAEAQQVNFHMRQQAFADLAKSYWIIEKVVPEYYDVSQYQTNDPSISDIMEVQQGVMSSLRKLTMSMKRNNFLPPEDAPLPQGLDPSIWLQNDGSQALLGAQKPTLMRITDSMPLGDSRNYFQYARMFAKSILSEDGESHQYTCLMLISFIREPEDKSLSMVVTNQGGTYTLCVRADGKLGATWDDVSWNARSNSIEVKLPRGFRLLINCSQNDYRVFWGIYDYEQKIHSGLKQRHDEHTIFDSTLKSMQYLDPSGTAGFPKEPLAQCRVKIFEKILVEKAATGARIMHRGYRIALVTHPSTKTLRGVNQHLQSNHPILFDFLRGDGGFPGFALTIEERQTSYKLLLTFNDARERMVFHDRLTGTARGNEVVVAEVNIKSLKIDCHPIGEKDSRLWKTLPWQTARIINRELEEQGFITVLSDNLRMVVGFGTGSLTDRLNVDQGELKIRLSVTAENELNVLRLPQQDITCSTLESKGSKEIFQKFGQALDDITKLKTTRTYTFPSIKELHLFQAALTGFEIVFDGMAISFNISRRRMVVPIYKKWDAMTTRLQVVKRNTHVQLLAFFENFSHGDCMNFELKSTDVFESSGKPGKWSLRIVDAKFALPKGHGEEIPTVENRFLCLDSPEYPGEHDDITIVFEHEAGMSAPLQYLRSLLTASRT